MDFKSKATSFVVGNRKIWATIALIASIVAMCYGGYRLVAYSVPLYTGDPYSAVQAGVGDEAAALYNTGLTAYKAERYDLAKEFFAKGYSKLTDESGQIPASRQNLAAEFQFMLGNLLLKSGKTEDAAEAYKQALRHNPNHLTAKYNLELIMQPPQGGQGGNGQGEGNGPGKPGDQPGQGDQPGEPGKKPGPGAGHGPRKGI